MRNRSTAHPLALLLLCAGLLLLFSACANAQVKVTANPSSIADAAKPSPVVLHVTKDGNTAVDKSFNDQFNSVKVGDATVQHQFDAANSNITITPPASLSGAQKVQLLDKNSQLLGEVTLQYPAASSQPGSSGGSTDTRSTDILAKRIDDTARSLWYPITVALIFAALLLPFSFTLARVINFSKSSFRNPLGFPVGSFRAMLAYTLVAFVGFYILTSILTASDFRPPDSLLGIVATVVGFYFGTRSTEEMTTADAGIVRGTVRLGTNPARGATVKFKRDDGAVPYIRITDVDGHFVLVGAKAGKYKVTAEITGSPASDAAEVSVSEGSDQEIAITIKEPKPPAPPAPPNPPGQPNQPGQPNP